LYPNKIVDYVIALCVLIFCILERRQDDTRLDEFPEGRIMMNEVNFDWNMLNN
jgi:hypothetical protein